MQQNLVSAQSLPVPDVASSQYLPCVEPEEVLSLATRYGAPLRRHFDLPVDDSIRNFRMNGVSDRRAEVVFALCEPAGCVWVHAKRSYPRHLYRLPSGGICWDEGVEAALLREIAEETALDVEVQRFLGLLEYTFHEGERTAGFASYVFQVACSGGAPCPHASEAITEFRRVAPAALFQIAADLRCLPAERSAWGQWRALAHDLVHEALTDPAAGAL